MELTEVSTGIGIKKPEEPGKNIEKGASRETVVKAFNYLNARVENIPDDPARPEIAWIKKSIKDAHDKTDLENGKDTFTSEFENHHTGEKFTQEEGIPTELLLQLITEEIKKVPKGSEEWKLLRKNARIIYRSSRKFREIPHRMEPSKYEGRLHQEALWIYEDPNRATGSERGDWDKAQNLLNNRLELILPKRPGRTTRPGGITAAGAGAGTPPAGTPSPDTEPDAEPETEANTTAPDNDETEPEPQIQPQAVEQIRREFVIANRSLDIRKRAQELAELQLREEQRRGSILNPLNWARKAKFRIMEEYYRQQYIERATNAMIENNNSYLTMDLVKNTAVQTENKLAEERQAGKAKVEEIKIQAAEGIALEGTTVKEAKGKLKDALMDEIIRPIVMGTDSTLLEAKIESYEDVQEALEIFIEKYQNEEDPDFKDLKDLFGKDATKYKTLANYFASDLLEMGQQIKEDISASKYSTDQLNEIVRIQLANTNWAAETESTFNLTDRAVRWAESHRLTGTIINPATIGAGLSILAYGGMRIAGVGGRAMQFGVPLAGLAPGAFFAGIRRNYDLKVDRAAHQVERAYNKQIPKGAERREAMEKFAYNTASVNELLNGGGQELLTGAPRRSMQELLALDLSEGQTSNRDEVARRIMEIRTRLDFSSQQKVDLITFGGREQVEQGRLELLKAVVEAKKALINAGMSEADINLFGAQWSQKFIQNKEQQDKSFRNFRLRNAVGAAAFGGLAGATAGLVTQEGWALIGRGVFDQNLGPTVIEQIPGTKGIMEFFHLPTADQAGMGKEVLQQLYEHPGNLKINDNLTLAVNGQDPLRAAGFLDGAGNPIDGPPMHLTSDGKLVFSGTFDNLPEPFKGMAKPNVDTNFNIHKDIQDMITQGKERSGVFQHGNTIISVDGTNKTFSMQAWDQDPAARIDIHGTINPDGSFNVDPNSLSDIGPQNWDKIQDRLITEAWKLEKITPAAGPGSATVVDAMFNQPPDVLKARGLIETEQFNKQWNFHVLRPDIVDATGNHTHNELTLHLGGKFQVSTGEFRTGSALPGELNFGGDIKGDLIPSNLPGVPAQHDAVLDSLIAKNGPITHKDMLFAVDLTNGKQIMIPADVNGNAKLPQELFDPSTGQPRGVKSIASVILEKPDGTILKAGELANTGQIPQGSLVHSLASEKFLEVTPPPAEIVHLIPPEATEFDFPSSPESPPIIPIPFAPRHPLERTRIILPPPSMESLGLERRDGGAGPAQNVRQVIRSTTPRSEWERRLAQLFPNRKPRGFENIRVNPEGSIESEEIMSVIRESYIESPHIYVPISGAIGDVALTTAYINGLRQYANKLGLEKKITVLAPENLISLLKPSAQKYGYDIVPIVRHHGINSARELIAKENETGAMILEFDFELGHEAPEVELLDNEGIAIRYLFSSSIGLYPTTRSGSHRFTSYFNDLLSVPKQERINLHPEITLPENNEELFREMVDKYKIDTNKNQISIIIEGSFPAKRYSLENWRDVIAELSQTYPETEFNVISNPQNSNYSRDQLDATLGSLPGVRFVNEDLTNISILLKNQKLVLGNDTGLAHIAATVQNGPPVISLHLPTTPPHIWSSDTNRHMGIVPKRSLLKNEQDIYDLDESQKWINKIPPKEVIEKALEVLRTSFSNSSTPPTGTARPGGPLHNAGAFARQTAENITQQSAEAQRIAGENLRQLGGRIDTLAHQLGTTLGDNRERVLNDLLPALDRYIDTSRTALGTSLQGLRSGQRITQLESKLKSLAAQARTIDGKGSLALITEIQKTANQYRQQIEAILEKRRQQAPAAPEQQPPQTPTRPGLFSRIQNRVGGVFNRGANAADATIDRSFEAVRDKTTETARKGAQAVSRENLAELGRNLKTSSDELDATLAANNEKFMQEILPAAVRYVESTRALINAGAIKIKPKLVNRTIQLEKKLKNLAAQSLTTAGRQSNALAVEVKRTVNSIQQIIGEQLEQRNQAAEAHLATPVEPLNRTIELPSEANDTSRDAEYADRFWQGLEEEDRIGLTDALINILPSYEGRTMQIPASGEQLTEQDKELMAAYRQLAREQGYELDDFHYNPENNSLVTFVRYAVDQTPVQTPPAPEAVVEEAPPEEELAAPPVEATPTPEEARRAAAQRILEAAKLMAANENITVPEALRRLGGNP